MRNLFIYGESFGNKFLINKVPNNCKIIKNDIYLFNNFDELLNEINLDEYRIKFLVEFNEESINQLIKYKLFSNSELSIIKLDNNYELQYYLDMFLSNYVFKIFDTCCTAENLKFDFDIKEIVDDLNYIIPFLDLEKLNNIPKSYRNSIYTNRNIWLSYYIETLSKKDCDYLYDNCIKYDNNFKNLCKSKEFIELSKIGCKIINNVVNDNSVKQSIINNQISLITTTGSKINFKLNHVLDFITYFKLENSIDKEILNYLKTLFYFKFELFSLIQERKKEDVFKILRKGKIDFDNKYINNVNVLRNSFYLPINPGTDTDKILKLLNKTRNYNISKLLYQVTLEKIITYHKYNKYSFRTERFKKLINGLYKIDSNNYKIQFLKNLAFKNNYSEIGKYINNFLSNNFYENFNYYLLMLNKYTYEDFMNDREFHLNLFKIYIINLSDLNKLINSALKINESVIYPEILDKRIVIELVKILFETFECHKFSTTKLNKAVKRISYFLDSNFYPMDFGKSIDEFLDEIAESNTYMLKKYLMEKNL